MCKQKSIKRLKKNKTFKYFANPSFIFSYQDNKIVAVRGLYNSLSFF